jgi:hypothetical protein
MKDDSPVSEFSGLLGGGQILPLGHTHTHTPKNLGCHFWNNHFLESKMAQKRFCHILLHLDHCFKHFIQIGNYSVSFPKGFYFPT